MNLKPALILPMLALVVLAYTQPAFAYIDPGTGTLLLQGLLGGVAGAVIVGKLYWTRIKDFVSSTFSRKRASEPEISAEESPAEAGHLPPG